MASMELPEKMRAQVLRAFNQPYESTTLPLPKITSENDLIVKVEAAGYCHTDAALAAGDRKGDPSEFPQVGGHEFAGKVVAVPDSPSPAAREYKIGSRVGVPGRGFHACGSCFECTAPFNDTPGYSFFCKETEANGLSKHGGFAEYAVVDARQCVPLADSLSAVDAAPMMCAGVTIYNAIKKCGLSPGQRVGIAGCGGGLGHLGLQFATAMGLRVTGIDAADGPLSLAESLETSAHIVDARSVPADDLVAQIGREDGKTDRSDMGLDAVIILPESQKSFDYAVKLLRNHGLCTVVSIPTTGFHVSAVDLVFRDIKVQGTILGSPSVLRETVAFAADHGVKAVKKIFALDRLNDLVAEYNRGLGGKLVLDMSL